MCLCWYVLVCAGTHLLSVCGVVAGLLLRGGLSSFTSLVMLVLLSMHCLLCGAKKRHVTSTTGSKNDICNRTQITHRKLYLHCGFHQCKKSFL